jgi:hypothetical protein
VIRTNSAFIYPKEDVEIAGFLSATIAWEIANDHQNSHKMMDLRNAPYDFVMSHSDTDLQRLILLFTELLTESILLLLLGV